MSFVNRLIEALECHGFYAPSDVAPPATEAEFAAAEQQIGFSLPIELRQLYTYSAHPFDRWRSRGGSPLYGLLMTQYKFLAWGEVLPKWHFDRELETGYPAINTDDVLPEDKVRPKAYDAGRVPVAQMIVSSCYIYVDCRPGPSGTVGQVVEATQEAMINWMGTSLSECIGQFIHCLDSGLIKFVEQGPEFSDWVDAGGESVLYDWWSVTGQRRGGYQGHDFA
jgi:cell wall assembly regulator SMI1